MMWLFKVLPQAFSPLRRRKTAFAHFQTAVLSKQMRDGKNRFKKKAEVVQNVTSLNAYRN